VPQQNMNDRVLWYTQAKVMGGGYHFVPDELHLP